MITRRNLVDLFTHLQNNIDTEDGMLDVTVGCDENKEYNWQTGDNSFSGPAYHYPHWAVVTIDRNSTLSDVVDDIVGQLEEALHYSTGGEFQIGD